MEKLAKYYIDTYERLKNEKPKNFKYKCFMSGFLSGIFRPASILLFSSTSLLISMLIIGNIFVAPAIYLLMCVNSGLIKIKKVKGIINSLVCCEPNRCDIRMGIWFYLSRYYVLCHMKGIIEEYEYYKTLKEKYEG